MSRLGRALLATGLILLVGCSSTARLNEPLDPEGLEIEEVVAPETLDTLESASTNAATNVTSGAPRGLVEMDATSAEEAFVEAIPPSPPPVSQVAQQNAEFGPGVSDGVIRIGATAPPKESALNAAFYPDTIRPDFGTVWDVLTDTINSTGGILGRRLEVVLLQGDLTPEQVCTRFTEEEDVIAVATNEIDAAPCFEDAEVATLAHDYALTPQDYRQAPHAVAPLGITLQRANKLYIDGLYQQGFFDGNPKIGLIRWDLPLYAQLSSRVVKPALARYGLEIEEELLITNPESEDQISNSQAQGWSGVERFKDAGVDRILTLDVASFILPEITDYAEAQTYYPRYGLNSLVGGEWDMERNQLKGAVGIGWMPWLDLEPAHAYRHGGEGARRCKDLMVAAGEGKQMDTYNEAIWTSSICDAVLLLKAAVEAAGPSITADSIVAGVERLGTSFQASNTLVTRFEPGRHEGVAAIRFLRWFVGCECFRYTSDLLDAG